MNVAARTAVRMLLCLVLCLSVGCSSKPDDPSERKEGKGKRKRKRPDIAHQAKGQAQTSGVEDDLIDVFFISPATLPHGAELPPPPKGAAPRPLRHVGFAVGAANTVLKTIDSGKTWRRLLARKGDGPHFDRVLFNSPISGWVGNRDILLHTADGGGSWSPAAGLPGIVDYYGSYTATAAFYLQIKPPTCGATVYRTTDGAKWEGLPTGLPRNDYQAVFFVDNLHGWVAGRGGGGVLTVDGGKTWQEYVVPGKADIDHVHFTTLKTGWAKAYYDGLWRTTDGGRTWEKQTVELGPAVGIRDMQFLDERTGFLLVHVETGKSELRRTTDGGETWAAIGTHGVSLAAMSFVDANHGWVVGPGGCIFHYDLGPTLP